MTYQFDLPGTLATINIAARHPAGRAHLANIATHNAHRLHEALAQLQAQQATIRILRDRCTFSELADLAEMDRAQHEPATSPGVAELQALVDTMAADLDRLDTVVTALVAHVDAHHQWGVGLTRTWRAGHTCPRGCAACHVIATVPPAVVGAVRAHTDHR